MSEKVEQVARAICARTDISMDGETGPVFDDPDYMIPAHKRTDGVSIPRWKLYEVQARAAIAALREPTKEMILAGMTEQSCTLADEWRAMIDEVLK